MSKFGFFIIIFTFTSFLFSCQNKKQVEMVEESADTVSVSKLDRQIQLLNSKIKNTSNNHSLYYQRAQLYVKKNKFLLAINDMETATKLDEKNIVYHMFLGELYFKVTNIDAAIKTYEKITQLDPESDKGFLELGRIYLYQAKPVECIEHLNEALRRNQYNPETYALKASYYLQLNDTARAISNLVTSVDVDPDYFKSYLDLGYIYGLQKKPEGIQYYTNALRLQPNDEDALFGRGKLYQEIDSFDKAIRDFQKILERSNDTKVNYQLGYLYFLIGKFEQAIQFFSATITNAPNHLLAHYGLAISYDSLGNKEMARENYLKVLELDPNDEDAKLGLNKLN